MAAAAWGLGETGAGGDCEFTPGASRDVSPVTAMGGKLLISTVVSLLALAGAGVRRYVPSGFFFNMNLSFDSAAPRRSTKHTREADTANVKLIAETIDPLTSSAV